MRLRFLSQLSMWFLTALLLAGCGDTPHTGDVVPPSTERAEEPVRALNVLLIVADDLGLQLGSYGDSVIETPHLDALAASGVQFDVAYVTQASCSPSRASILSGLHAWANGQQGLVSTGLALAPELHDRTLPNRLSAAGYRTGIIGKLHVAPAESFRFDFEETDAFLSRDASWVTEMATRFVDEAPEQPFFLMVNYADPHVVRRNDTGELIFIERYHGIPEKRVQPSFRTLLPFQRVDTAEIRERTAGYYNSIKRLDAAVGELMEQMAERGYSETTLVVFLSDHGPPFARAKTTVYEAGLRIPFIVRWPGVSQPMRSRAMVSTLDVLPTILDAAGLPLPDDLHGSSLRPVLQDPSARGRSHLVGEFNFHTRDAFYPRRAIRNRHHKLIHNLLAGRAQPVTTVDDDPAYEISQTSARTDSQARQAFRTFADPPEFELYALTADPYEFENLAGRPDYYGVEQELKAELLAYRERTNDPLLEPAKLEQAIEFSRGPAPDLRPWWRRLLDR